jgi:hypothetical protein
MEDVAEDYLNELIQRNMVQAERMSVNGRVKQCRLHDLLRDLSTSKAKAQKISHLWLDVVAIQYILILICLAWDFSVHNSVPSSSLELSLEFVIDISLVDMSTVFMNYQMPILTTLAGISDC